jgi:hypothetical protein
MMKNLGRAIAKVALVTLCGTFVFASLVACGSTGATSQQSTAAEADGILQGFPLHEGTELLPWQFADGKWSCQGPQLLEAARYAAPLPHEPVEFDWSGLDAAKKAPDTFWGYYRVPTPYSEVAAFYRENTVMLPFGQQELY